MTVKHTHHLTFIPFLYIYIYYILDTDRKAGEDSNLMYWPGLNPGIFGVLFIYLFIYLFMFIVYH